MRSGCVSMLVPWSACAVSAAVVRLRNTGSPAPRPMPYSPRARKSRREQENVMSVYLGFGGGEHEIEQLAQRRFLARRRAGALRVKAGAIELRERRAIFRRERHAEEARREVVHHRLWRRGVRGAGHR